MIRVRPSPQDGRSVEGDPLIRRHIHIAAEPGCTVNLIYNLYFQLFISNYFLTYILRRALPRLSRFHPCVPRLSLFLL
jgi:hypothetical protein